MSKAGTKSNQGDDYQRLIAINWLIKLLEKDSNIEYIQVESNGLYEIDEDVEIDDIVIAYGDQTRRHIQAKKNQSSNRAWTLSDLGNELIKARDQLEINANVIVEFCSRTPFGNFQSLVESVREYPDYNNFYKSLSKNLEKVFYEIVEKWERGKKHVYQLLKRIDFGPLHNFDGWRKLNEVQLSALFSHSNRAIPVLESLINTHQSKLSGTLHVIKREDVDRVLKEAGVIESPGKSETEILEIFKSISQIGRYDWQRTIAGEKIDRPELSTLKKIIGSSGNTLISDKPGSGKTCFLLDLADYVDQCPDYELLFIKGDRFTDLKNQGIALPENIFSLCADISESRHLVIIIDSLDVLSIYREHGMLKFFLAMIDQLMNVSNISIVAACRTFDLKYDPLLRDRAWDNNIQLEGFDYENVVEPLLLHWNIDVSSLKPDLKLLLQNPQNLRVFESISHRSISYQIRNTFELHKAYLDEVVIKSPELGEKALEVLQKLADQILTERSQMIMKASFDAKVSIIRILISNGILFEDNRSNIGFSHQTLLDNLIVHSALAKSQSLKDFITSYPPLPFIRPAVRNFVFYLRLVNARQFSVQIWSALASDSIAYHFKRLIIECLSEIVPTDEDWPLINRLHIQQPELFKRFFWLLKGNEWFYIIQNFWLPSLNNKSSSLDSYWLLISRLNIWMNQYPDFAIQCWNNALSNRDWGMKGDANIVWHISIDLRKFEHWDKEGVYELLTSLLELSGTDRDEIGNAISRFVEKTDSYDELLWKYITKDIVLKDCMYELGNQLKYSSHNFHSKSFCRDRLLESEVLLDFVLDAIITWSDKSSKSNNGRSLKSVFIFQSSWEERRSIRGMHHMDSLKELLENLEFVLIEHCKINNKWWRQNEPKLRNSKELVIRYFLIRAYSENSESNISGISYQLTDKELIRYGRLEYELGVLIQKSFYMISSDIQRAIQELILTLYKDDGVGHETYNYLICIPSIFRVAESQIFIDKNISDFGNFLPEPNIRSWGGTIGSPISPKQLQSLSDKQLLKLLKYYQSDTYSSHPSDHLRGGQEEVDRTLADAAAMNPLRFIKILTCIEKLELRDSCINSIIKGLTDNLRYRAGNLQPPSDWEYVEPQPNIMEVAQLLIKLVFRYPQIWQDGYAVSRALEACCKFAPDKEISEILTFLLFRLVKHPNPELDKQRIFSSNKEGMDHRDIRSDAINSVRGVAAGAAASLYTKLQEKSIKPPVLLFPLLRHFGRDQTQSVRAAILEYLPYLTAKNQDSGWQLFNDIFREKQKHLWVLAENHLYYQYHNNYDLVKPSLDRIMNEAPEVAGET